MRVDAKMYELSLNNIFVFVNSLTLFLFAITIWRIEKLVKKCVHNFMETTNSLVACQQDTASPFCAAASFLPPLFKNLGKNKEEENSFRKYTDHSTPIFNFEDTTKNEDKCDADNKQTLDAKQLVDEATEKATQNVERLENLVKSVLDASAAVSSKHANKLLRKTMLRTKS